MGNGSYWDGGSWSSVQVDSPFDKSRVFVQSTAPADPTPMRTGDLFIDTDTAKLSFRNGTSWTQLSELSTIDNITGLQSELDKINGAQITGDLDVQVTPGNFIFLTDQVSLANHHPVEGAPAGTLIVSKASVYITQRVTYMNGAVTPVQEYVRFSDTSGSTWHEWFPVATTLELATNSEVIAGTNTTRAVTPDGLSARLEAYPQEIVPAGTIQIFAGASIPPGWLVCDGSAFVAATYPRLYAAIGTLYGGTSTNPMLPNLKGKVIVGLDGSQTEFDTLGKSGGAKTHTLASDEMPSHTHTIAHTHAIDHDHGSFTSGGGSSHSHTINHGHAASTSSYNGDHTHAQQAWLGTLGYRTFGGGSGTSTGTYKTLAMPTSNNSTDTIASTTVGGGHQHTTYTSDYYGSSGGESGHTHTVDVPVFSGTSGGSSSASSGATGSGTAHNNLQPYLSLRYIIRAV